MCYRVSTPNKIRLKEQFPDFDILEFDTSYHQNGFDFKPVPVVTNYEANVIQPVRWGLMPAFARSTEDVKKYGGGTLNAKCETIFTTAMYRELAPKKRCLIFVTGFFEFQHVGKEKLPYFISMADDHIFTLGGVWTKWKDQLTCSIITTPANKLLSEIHNSAMRMPLILDNDKWDAWLDDTQPRDAIEALMVPYTDEKLKALPISNMLTQKGVDANVPEVLLPVAPKSKEPPKQTLF